MDSVSIILKSRGPWCSWLDSSRGLSEDLHVRVLQEILLTLILCFPTFTTSFLVSPGPLVRKMGYHMIWAPCVMR